MRTVGASALALAFFLAAGSAPASAQIPSTPAEARRLLEQDPDAVRQALEQSGLTPDEIRSRLRAMGYVGE